MLILSRKPNEEIIIGDNVRVTVTQLNGGRVSLGITAPPEMRIVRAELDDNPGSQPEPIPAK